MEATMIVEQQKARVRRVFEEAFNQGELDVIDETIAVDGVDHQQPDEPSFREHLKEVVRAMREAFPDLHFEIVQMLGEGEWVATYTVMTGTQTGALRPPLLPSGGPAMIPPTGRPVRVAHMHMIRFEGGQNTELWHVMDTIAMLGQLGLLPAPEAAASRK
jgi:predicted ester cyclase